MCLGVQISDVNLGNARHAFWAVRLICIWWPEEFSLHRYIITVNNSLIARPSITGDLFRRQRPQPIRGLGRGLADTVTANKHNIIKGCDRVKLVSISVTGVRGEPATDNFPRFSPDLSVGAPTLVLVDKLAGKSVSTLTFFPENVQCIWWFIM